MQPSMTLDYSGALVLTVGNIPEATISQIFRLQPMLEANGAVVVRGGAGDGLEMVESVCL